jgi:hypothetical protein
MIGILWLSVMSVSYPTSAIDPRGASVHPPDHEPHLVTCQPLARRHTRSSRRHQKDNDQSPAAVARWS